ncbi:MAG TPA: hypothetical protein VGO90_08025 [Chthoniobacteraceae bacterium]|jgi:hypothetical protein|nr:hypothetical protein [Chthoniobacter sp.]HEV7867615.1 hypothetical protein [Chthoniobacteraceae bacterium]
MRSERREALLKMAVGVVVGLFVLDRMVLSPAISSWKEQSGRIAELREKVKRGSQLVDRERSIRARWADMLRTDLPDDLSAAESDVQKRIGRWASESRVSITSLNFQWRNHEEGHDTYECRATASGDQAALARLLYEIEVDALPARIEECELGARDAQGRQLLLTARFSFMRLTGLGTKKK